jgi:chromosome segregation ATPase
MQNTHVKQTMHNLQKLIVLGAGDLMLKTLQAWSAKQISLVEADSVLCEQLNNLIAENKKTDVVINVQHIAVADKQETRMFHYLNLPELSGFNVPEGLLTLYPGLKTVESQSIQTQSLQDFLANQNLEGNSGSKNGLIIDIPTQLDELLTALLESNWLSCFSEIQVTAFSAPLSEDNQTIEYWLNQLQAKGFELQNQSNLNDDFINYSVIKNPLFDRLQSTEQQLQQAKVENQKLETQTSEMANDLVQKNQLISTKDKELKDYQAWLTESKSKISELEAEKQQQVDELDQAKAQIQSLTDERNHEQKRKDDEKAKNENLTQEVAVLKTDNATLQEQFVKLQKEHEALKSQNDKHVERLTSEREQNRSERDSARKERDDLKGKIEQKDKKVISLTQQLNDTQVQLNNAKKQSSVLYSQQTQTIAKQKQLESQLTKAEAQIDIIKALLIKPSPNDQ